MSWEFVENRVGHLSGHLETGMTDRGHDFEGYSEQASQQPEEAGLLEVGKLWNRLPSGAAEQELWRQWGQAGYPRHQVSRGAAGTRSRQEDLETGPGLA